DAEPSCRPVAARRRGTLARRGRRSARGPKRAALARLDALLVAPATGDDAGRRPWPMDAGRSHDRTRAMAVAGPVAPSWQERDDGLGPLPARRPGSLRQHRASPQIFAIPDATVRRYWFFSDLR